MKLIIAGGRDFTNYPALIASIKELLHKEHTPVYELTIISGMARGADSLGVRLARDYNIPLIEMPADWYKYGKSAGYKRNMEMAKIATHLLAAWDGYSKGTGHMINIAKERKLKVTILSYDT